MPLVIKLDATVTLDNTWCSKEDWHDNLVNDLPRLIELLEDDPVGFLEAAGGIRALIKDVRWEDAR